MCEKENRKDKFGTSEDKRVHPLGSLGTHMQG
jgi:hypothetical protein